MALLTEFVKKINNKLNNHHKKIYFDYDKNSKNDENYEFSRNFYVNTNILCKIYNIQNNKLYYCNEYYSNEFRIYNDDDKIGCDIFLKSRYILRNNPIYCHNNYNDSVLFIDNNINQIVIDDNNLYKKDLLDFWNSQSNYYKNENIKKYYKYIDIYDDEDEHYECFNYIELFIGPFHCDTIEEIEYLIINGTELNTNYILK